MTLDGVLGDDGGVGLAVQQLLEGGDDGGGVVFREGRKVGVVAGGGLSQHAFRLGHVSAGYQRQRAAGGDEGVHRKGAMHEAPDAVGVAGVGADLQHIVVAPGDQFLEGADEVIHQADPGLDVGEVRLLEPAIVEVAGEHQGVVAVLGAEGGEVHGGLPLWCGAWIAIDGCGARSRSG